MLCRYYFEVNGRGLPKKLADNVDIEEDGHGYYLQIPEMPSSIALDAWPDIKFHLTRYQLAGHLGVGGPTPGIYADQNFSATVRPAIGTVQHGLILVWDLSLEAKTPRAAWEAYQGIMAGSLQSTSVWGNFNLDAALAMVHDYNLHLGFSVEE